MCVKFHCEIIYLQNISTYKIYLFKSFLCLGIIFDIFERKFFVERSRYNYSNSEAHAIFFIRKLPVHSAIVISLIRTMYYYNFL